MQELVDKIMTKDSYDESDMKILMQNKHLLSQNQLVRLGLVSAPQAVEPVKVAETLAEPVTEVEEPKKRGRKKKIV